VTVNVNPGGKADAVPVATEIRDGEHVPLYQNANLISTSNSRAAATLAAAATFQGVGEDVSNFGRVGVSITSDNATDGVLTMEVSHDNVTWGGPTRTWADTRYAQPHMWNIVEKYFRIKYVNGTTEATNLSIQVQYSNNADILLGHQLNETLLDETEAIAVRSVAVGATVGGHYQNVGVTHNGSMRTNLPLTAFGEVLTAQKTPQVQIKFPYGINSDLIQSLINNSSGGSAVTATAGVANVVAGGTYPSFAQLRSLDTVRYGPGQGSEAEFTGAWPTGGVALSSQLIGPGDDDEGFFFGYDGVDFGIHHHSHGELEIQALEITGAATGTGNITITLDGTAVTVAITSGWTINQVNEAIKNAEADFQNAARGWEVLIDDNLIVHFVSLVAEPAAGAFTFVDTDTTGVTANAFSTEVTGVVPTKADYPQTTWNVDVMDGTGGATNPSGVTFAYGATPGDTTLAIDHLNPFRVTWQFLGTGAIVFEVETPKNGWQVVHIINSGSHGITTSLRNPTLHLNMIAKTESGYSGGNLTMHTASMAGFIQCKESDKGIRHSAHGQKSITTTTQNNVLMLHSESHYGGTRNKINTYPDFMTVANEVTKTITVFITINPTRIDGTPSLTTIDAHTQMVYDTAGTTFTGGSQLVPFDIPGNSTINVNLGELGEYLRPGDRWIFSAAKTVSGTNGVVGIGVTWKDRV